MMSEQSSAGQQSAGHHISALLDRFDWRRVLVAAALAVGLSGRLLCGWGSPFWFDETFSGVIATQPDAHALLEWCLSELTGPMYYMPLWVWRHFAGSSDAAMRLPSLLLSSAAPVLIYWKGHRDRDVRLFWAVLLALWMPGLAAASEARPYAQLFFLATVQAAAFLVVLRPSPRLAPAMVWGSASALLVTTHYHALLICAVQGLSIVAVHRWRARALWPAALVFVPVAGWMALHLSYVVAYATSPAAWYQLLPPAAVVTLPQMVFGSELHGDILFVAIAVTSAIGMRRRMSAVGMVWLRRSLRLTPDRALALSGVVSITIIFALAFIRPSFSPRYLTPAIPALLFGIALWARGAMARNAASVTLVVAMMFLTAAGGIRYSLMRNDADPRYNFNLEQASAWLMEHHPRRMLFLWDSGTGTFTSAAHLGEVGSFFFRRAGEPVAMTVARIRDGEDPNVVVPRLAARNGDTAILWIITDMLPPQRYPRFSQTDDRWECRRFSKVVVVVEACRLRRTQG